MTQPTYEQQLREEFREKFLLDHGEFGQTLVLGNSFDDMSDWWIERMKEREREFVKEVRVEIEKMKIETKSEFDVGYEFATPHLIRHNGYNNGVRNILSLPLLQVNEEKK